MLIWSFFMSVDFPKFNFNHIRENINNLKKDLDKIQNPPDTPAVEKKTSASERVKQLITLKWSKSSPVEKQLSTIYENLRKQEKLISKAEKRYKELGETEPKQGLDYPSINAERRHISKELQNAHEEFSVLQDELQEIKNTLAGSKLLTGTKALKNLDTVQKNIAVRIKTLENSISPIPITKKPPPPTQSEKMHQRLSLTGGLLAQHRVFEASSPKSPPEQISESDSAPTEMQEKNDGLTQELVDAKPDSKEEESKSLSKGKEKAEPTSSKTESQTESLEIESQDIEKMAESAPISSDIIKKNESLSFSERVQEIAGPKFPLTDGQKQLLLVISSDENLAKNFDQYLDFLKLRKEKAESELAAGVAPKIGYKISDFKEGIPQEEDSDLSLFFTMNILNPIVFDPDVTEERIAALNQLNALLNSKSGIPYDSQVIADDMLNPLRKGNETSPEFGTSKVADRALTIRRQTKSSLIKSARYRIQRLLPENKRRFSPRDVLILDNYFPSNINPIMQKSHWNIPHSGEIAELKGTCTIGYALPGEIKHEQTVEVDLSALGDLTPKQKLDAFIILQKRCNQGDTPNEKDLEALKKDFDDEQYKKIRAAAEKFYTESLIALSQNFMKLGE